MADLSAGILTDVGTNELEVVEFYLDERPHAINVSKVREIIRPQTAMPLPESHACVLGVFRNREDVIPLVDLGKWLECRGDPDPRLAKIIVAEFNRIRVGFLVHGVNRIHRVSWEDLEAPAPGSMAESRSALGFIRLGKGTQEEERIVFLLDFERIVAELGGNNATVPTAPREDAAERRSGCTVLIAEDSGLIRSVLIRELEKGGYSVIVATNGQEAWDQLDTGAQVGAVISDIEMPLMDGHHLTRRIKEDDRFRGIPVVLYSSMIYEEMRVKGESVGADAQICKPDLPNLLSTLDGLTSP
jgi:two-component system chemotaxis response regulator CheV